MSTLQDLPKVLKASLRKRQVPGASVAVLRKGRIVASAAAGVVNLSTQVPTTTDSVFQIGSISKILTTTLIMQLVDQGKLDLDMPIVEYLPEFRVADLDISRQVTARHFLSHQSGIDGDLFVDAGRGDDSIAKLIMKATMVPSLFPLGQKHSYCNLGFAVLGRVAEVITGKTYDELLKQKIFDPLEMAHAFSLPEDSLKFRCAIGHVPSRRKNVWHVTHTPYLSFGQKAAGSTPAMSAADLLKFAQMHLHNGRSVSGEKILTASSVKLMQRRQIKMQKHTSRAITHWGLGWFLMNWNGTRVFGHDGATIGQFAFLRVVPEKNLAVAILTNGGDAAGLFEDVHGHLFQGLAKISEPAAVAPTGNVGVDLSCYTGRYANINTTFEITQSRGVLKITSRENGGGELLPNGARLAFVDPQTAALVTGDPLLDRQRYLFSDAASGTGKMAYMANGMRQFKRDAQV